MRPVQGTLTSPYAVRFDIGLCPDHGRGCVVVIATPSLTPDGVFVGALASVYEHCTVGEAEDVIDGHLMDLDVPQG